MAFNILKLTFQLVFQNWLPVLRIVWLWAIFTFAFEAYVRLEIEDSVAYALLLLLGAFLVMIVGSSAIAIAWHRYLLRGETVGNAYLLNSDWPNSSFVWAFIKVGLIGMLVAIPFLLLMLFGADRGALNGPIWNYVLGVAEGVVTLMVVTRFSLVLPATAVDQQMTLRQSYQLTAPHSNEIFKLVICLVLLTSLPSLMESVLSSLTIEPMGLVGTSASYLFHVTFELLTSFVLIAALSVLYGHLIEGRDI